MFNFNKTYLLNGIYSREKSSDNHTKNKNKNAKQIEINCEEHQQIRVNKINTVRSHSTSSTLQSRNFNNDNSSKSIQSNSNNSGRNNFLSINVPVINKQQSISNHATPTNNNKKIIKKGFVRFQTQQQIFDEIQKQLLMKKTTTDDAQNTPKIVILPPQQQSFSKAAAEKIKDKRRISYDIKIIQKHQKQHQIHYQYEDDKNNQLQEKQQQQTEQFETYYDLNNSEYYYESHSKNLNNNEKEEGETKAKSLQASPSLTYVGGFVIQKDFRRNSCNNKLSELQSTTVFKSFKKQRKSRFLPSISTNVSNKDSSSNHNISADPKQQQSSQQFLTIPKQLMLARLPSKEESNQNQQNINQSSKQQLKETSFCQICSKDFVKQGILNCCNHIFCFTCISTWNVKQHVCPICFKLFKAIEKKNLFQKNTTEINQKSQDQIHPYPLKPVLIQKVSKLDEIMTTQKEKANFKFFQCTKCQARCCTAFCTKYIYSEEEVICQNCYQNEHKKCQKCLIVCQQKLKKFQGLKFCNTCHKDMVNKYCTSCQIMLSEENTCKKLWKNGEKICKNCRLNKFCLFCEDEINKMSYTQLNNGKVCLNCYAKNYCVMCKQDLSARHLKIPVEGKDYITKINEQQNKTYIYCWHCYKTKICSNCDQMLKFGKSFKKDSLSNDLICENCFRQNIKKKSYLNFLKLE